MLKEKKFTIFSSLLSKHFLAKISRSLNLQSFLGQRQQWRHWWRGEFKTQSRCSTGFQILLCGSYPCYQSKEQLMIKQSGTIVNKAFLYFQQPSRKMPATIRDFCKQMKKFFQNHSINDVLFLFLKRTQKQKPIINSQLLTRVISC